KLAVRIQIAVWDHDAAVGFEDQQVWLRRGIKLDAIRRATRNDDVIERLKGQHAEYGAQRALALMDEDHFVGRSVAIELGLWLGRAAARHDDVIVYQQRQPASDRVAVRLQAAGAEVMMPQRRFRYDIERDFTGRLDFAGARRGPQMIADAVGAAEAARSNDFF